MSNIDDLANQREQLRIQQREILDQINGTKTRLRTVRDELQNLRKTRDGLNDTVRALKQTRDSLREQSKTGLAILRELLKKMSDRPHASIAEKELAQLEWKVQTSPLERDEEKRLMLRIRALEIQVTGYHKVLKLREEITKMREEADQIHTKIQELAADSQKHHQDIVQLSEVFHTLRLRHDEQGKELDQLRRKASETNRKFVDLKDSQTEAEMKIRRKKEEAIKDALKDTAQKKLTKGEKLTLHEFGALYGEGEE